MPFGARDWRIAGAVGLVSLLFYAGFTQARFKSTDEFGLYLMTESLFERSTLEVPIHRHAHVGADGRLHAPFAIGQAVLALPLYVLGKTAARALPDDQWASPIASPVVAGGLETSGTFFRALAAFLIAPGISVFAYSPLLLLLPWTLRAAARRWPWECAAIAIYAATQLFYYANYRYWTGLWSAPGPRYLFPSCTLLLRSLGAWLDLKRSRLAHAALASLAAVGAIAQLALLTADWQAVTEPLQSAQWPAAIDSGRHLNYEPDFAFLFDPAASPIWGSLRTTAAGRIDSWLWKLAWGWPGEPARPAIALSLALLCAVGSAAGALGLWRAVAEQGV